MYLTEIILQSPEFQYESSEVVEILSRNYSSPAAKDFISTRIFNSGICKRSFVVPLEQIVELDGLQQRAQIYSSALPAMFEKLLAKSRIALSPNAVISSSCSVPTLPAMDIALIELLKLPHSPLRIPVYQHGCLGGVWALALAAKLNLPQTFVFSYELCSLLFQARSETLTQMMGAVLFADGAAGAVINKSPQDSMLNIIASSDFLIPNSSRILGYDILDTATQLVLSPQIPALLSEFFPPFVSSFLASNGLVLEQVKHFLIHPGGKKILDNLKDSLGLCSKSVESSYATLEAHGNMSSASIFFVLDHFLKKKEYLSSDYVLMFGIGPGINLQLVLCQLP